MTSLRSITSFTSFTSIISFSCVTYKYKYILVSQLSLVSLFSPNKRTNKNKVTKKLKKPLLTNKHYNIVPTSINLLVRHTCISTESQAPFVEWYLGQVWLPLCNGSKLFFLQDNQSDPLRNMHFLKSLIEKVMLSLRETTATPWGPQV